MSKERNIVENRNPNFLPNGKFAKGNTIGRMKKKGFTLTDLNKIAYEYGKSKNKDLLQHYVSQLYRDNRLLLDFINKNVPTKVLNELVGNLDIKIEKVNYKNDQTD